MIRQVANDQSTPELKSGDQSSNAALDRICDVIRESLNDDREAYVTELEKRLVKLSDVDPRNDFEIDTTTLLKMRDLRKSVSILRNDVTNMQSLFHDQIAQVQKQVSAFVVAAVAGREMSASREAHLQKMLDQMQIRFSKIDVPRITEKYEAEIAEHVERENKLSKALTRQQGKNVKLVQQNQALLARIQELENKKKQAEQALESLSEVTESNKELETQVKLLKATISEKNLTIDSLLNESSDGVSDAMMRQSLSESRLRLSELEKENSSLRQRLSEMEMGGDSQVFESSISEADSQLLAEKSASIPELKRSSRLAMNKARSLGWQNARLALEVEDLKSDKRELQQQVESLKESLQAETQGKMDRGELMGEIELISEELAASKKRIQDLDERVFQLSSANAGLEKKLRQNEDHAKDRNKSVKQMQEEIESYRKSAKSSEELISALQSKCKELEVSARRQRDKLNEQTQQLEMARSKREEAEKETQTLKDEILLLRQKTQTTTIRCDQTTEALEYARAELKNKEQALVNLLETDSATRRQMEEQEKRLDQYQEQIKEMAASSRASENETSRMKRTVEYLEGQLEEVKASKKECVRLLKQKEATIDKMEQTNSLLESQVKKLKIYLHDAKNQIGELRERLGQAGTDLKQAEEETEKVRAVQTQAAEKILKLRKKIDMQKSQFRQITTNQREVNLDLQNKLNEAIGQIETLRIEARDREEQVKAKDRQLTDFVKRNDTRLKSIDSNQQKLALESADLKTQIKLAKEQTDVFLEKMREFGEAQSLTDAFYIVTNLKQANDKMTSDMNEMRECLGLASDYPVPVAVSQLKTENDRMAKREMSIKELFPNVKTSDLSEEVRKTVSENQEIVPVLAALRKMLRTDDVISRVSDLKKFYRKHCDREDSLQKLIPQYDFATFPDVLQKIYSEFVELRQREKKLKSILSVNSGQDIPKQMAKVLAEMQRFLTIATEIKETTPVKGLDIARSWSQLKEHYEAMIDYEETLKQALPSDCPEGTTSERITLVLEQNSTFRQLQKELEAELPESIVGDLKTRVHVLSERYQTMSQSMKSIVQVLPLDLEGEVCDRVAQLVQRYNDDENQLNSIGVEMPEHGQASVSEGVGHIVQKLQEMEKRESVVVSLMGGSPEEAFAKLKDVVSDLKKNNSEREAAIQAIPSGIGGTLVEQVQSLVKDRALLQKMVQDIRGLLSADESENVVEKLQETLETLNSTQKTIADLGSILPEGDDVISRAKSCAECGLTSNEKLRDLASLLPGESDVEDITVSFRKVIDEQKKTRALISRMKNLLSVESETDFEKVIENLTKKLKEMISEDAAIKKCLPENIPGSTVEKVKQVVVQCVGYQKQYLQLKAILPEDTQGNLVARVSSIVEQNQKLQKEMTDLSNSVPLELTGTPVTRITAMISKYEDISTTVKQIQELMPSEIEGNVVQQVTEVIERLREQKARLNKMSDMFDDAATIEEGISGVVEQRNQVRAMCSRLRTQLRVDTDTEIPDALDQVVQKNKELSQNLQTIEDLLKSSDPIEAVKQTISKLDTLMKDQNEVAELLKVENTEDIVTTIKTSLKASADSARLISSIEDEIPQELEGDTLERVLKLVDSHRQKQKLVAELTKLFPDTKESLLVDAVSELVAKFGEQKQLEKDLEETIPDAGPLGIRVRSLADSNAQLVQDRDEILSHLPSDSQSNFKDRVIEIIEQNKNLTKASNEALKILSVHDAQGTLLERLNYFMEEYDKAQECLRECQQAFPSDFTGTLLEKIKIVLSELDEIQVSSDDLVQLLPAETEGEPKDRLSELIQGYNELKDIQKQLSQRDPEETGTVMDRIKRLFDLIDQQKKFEKEVKNAIPSDFVDSGLLESVTSLVTAYEKAMKRIQEVAKCIPSSFTGEVIDQVEQLVDGYNALSKQQRQIAQILSKETENIIPELTSLIEQKENITRELSAIKKAVPEPSSNIVDQIEAAFSEVERLTHEQERIKNSIPEEIKGSLPSQVRQLANDVRAKIDEIEAITAAIPDEFKGGVISRTRQLARSRQELMEERTHIRSIVPSLSSPEDLIRDVTKLAECREEANTALKRLQEVYGNDIDLTSGVERMISNKS